MSSIVASETAGEVRRRLMCVLRLASLLPGNSQPAAVLSSSNIILRSGWSSRVAQQSQLQVGMFFPRAVQARQWPSIMP